MQHQSDAQLLREYAARGSEPAFAEIVARHTDLIYSAALRQCGTPEAAGEIAQGVFINLARRACTLAKQLDENASLAGWLFSDTRFVALHWHRDERHREAHQRLVMENFDPSSETSLDWERVAPVLDEAMAELNEADREAVLLRYFQNQDFAAVGRALGVTDDAAQKRVSRAVERLREFFAKRGVTIGASGLVVVISTNAVVVAPAGLSAVITVAAVAGTTIATVATVIAMTTLQKTFIAAALAAAVGMGIYEARQASILRTQVQTIQQQHTPLVQQIDQLTREHDDALRQLAALRDENERLNRNTRELLKLRGEVGLLRGQMNSKGLSSGGRTLSEWLQSYDTNRMDLTAEAQNAIRQMGTNVIPELLNLLGSSTSGAITGWRLTCAFRALGPIAAPAVPALIALLQPSEPEWIRSQAAASLGFIGPVAQAAVPALIAALGDKDNLSVRMNSIGALHRIGGDSSVLVHVFTASLDDPRADVRIWAGTGLGQFGNKAESAVPKLLEALTRRGMDDEGRSLVGLVNGLESIGPTTNDVAPFLIKLFSHEEEGVRRCATNALIKMDPEAAARAGAK